MVSFTVCFTKRKKRSIQHQLSRKILRQGDFPAEIANTSCRYISRIVIGLSQHEVVVGEYVLSIEYLV